MTSRDTASTAGAGNAPQVPQILAFVEYYLPGTRSGGLVRSIHNMVAALDGLVQFRIVCRNRDFGQDRPYPEVCSDAWQSVGPAEVFYASERTSSFSGLRSLLRDARYDAIYLNLFFSFFACLRVLLLRRVGAIPDVPIIIAPRGCLTDEALGHKGLKKAAFLRLAQLLGLFDHLIWQASSELERDTIDELRARGIIGDAEVVLAPDLPAPERPESPRSSREPRATGALRAVSLARVSTTKNLRFALEVLGSVEAEVDFDIYGPIEDAAYWRRCEQAIASLPVNIRARYLGEIDPSQVHGTLGQYDLLVFPTRTENFGHTILEALQSGCAVLTTDRTPWSDLESAGAGWIVPLDQPDRFRERIEQAAAMSPEEREEHRRRAIAYARRAVEGSEALELNLALFSRTMNRGLPSVPA